MGSKSSITEYDVLGTVGEGAHGIVLKAQHKVSGKFVALKKVTLKKISEEGIPIQVIREIKSLQYIEPHENIVYLLDVFPQGMSFVLVFEYMPSNLWEILDSYKLTGSQAKCYMQMILNGVEFLHKNHIMHRDLKPANLLIAYDKMLKIGDFGLCRLFFPGESRAFSHQVATRWYRAPELLYGARYYNEGVDLWAVGCIFAEMLKGDPLFAGENDIDQLFKVISGLGTPDEKSWPGRTSLPDYNKITFVKTSPIPLETLVPCDLSLCTDFLAKFLLYDSNCRISAQKALEDEFFKADPLPCCFHELPDIPKSKSNFFKDFDADLIATAEGDTAAPNETKPGTSRP